MHLSLFSKNGKEQFLVFPLFSSSKHITFDVGSSSVKILGLNGNKKKRKVETLGFEVLPHGTVVNGIMADFNLLQQKIKTLASQLGISASSGSASVNLNAMNVLIKKVQLPVPKDTTQLTDHVFYYAEQHFQHNLNDLYFDYHIFDTSPRKDTVSIVLLGAKKDIVEQYVFLFKNLGFKLSIFDCDVLSLLNFFQVLKPSPQGDSSLTALIHVGAYTTHVIFTQKSELLFTKTFHFGGESYTAFLSEKLSLTRDQAESLKLNASKNDVPGNKDIILFLNEMNHKISFEIKESFDFFIKSQDDLNLQNARLENIVLSGGASRTLGLAAALASAFTAHLSFFKSPPLQFSKKIPKNYVEHYSHLFIPAYGLSWRWLLS